MAGTFYGSGEFYIKNNIASPAQAYKAGTLQGVTISFKGDTTDLFGASRFPVATAMGRQAIDGKADYATLDGRLVSAVLGATVTTGRSIFKTEALLITANAVQSTQTTGFEDFGVVDASGNPMDRVAAIGSTLGQYTVDSDGTYGFCVSPTPEAGTVVISYRYTVSTGFKGTFSNTTVTAQPHFVGVFTGEWDQGSGTTEKVALELYAVSLPSLDFTFKNDAFQTESLAFKAGANASGQVGVLHFE